MSLQKPKILFLGLRVFSFTGGIEKVCRCFATTLENGLQKQSLGSVKVLAVYDDIVDERYLSKANFTGFRGNILKFLMGSFFDGLKADVIVISHINLAFPALLLKILFGKRVIIIAHGIEVWRPLNIIKKIMIRSADMILAVSNFTKQKITDLHQLQKVNIEVLNNCFDPYFKFSDNFNKPQHLLNRYGLTNDQKILFALTRLSFQEQYKGYDAVITQLPLIIKDFPDLMYIIAGKADQQEKERIEKLIAQNNLQKHVLLAGFISDDEVTDHFLLADVFVMPSRQEGFGIVFIEAMANGLPVIAGNIDGSTDALKNGESSKLINPDNGEEIRRALTDLLNHQPNKEQLAQKTRETFSFDQYESKVLNVLTSIE